METTTDEINEGLARYMGYRHVPDATVLYTDSLDACEMVADKLGVSDIEFQVDEPGRHWCGVQGRSFEDAYGPTRAHAWAAALWAAVQEGQE